VFLWSPQEYGKPYPLNFDDSCWLAPRTAWISAKSCLFQRHLENVSGVPQLISSLQARLEAMCAQLYDGGPDGEFRKLALQHLMYKVYHSLKGSPK